jgi:hypothetical protein
LTKPLKLKRRQHVAMKFKLVSIPNLPGGTYCLVASVKAADGTITDVAGGGLSIAAPFVKAVVSDVKPVSASAAPGKPAGLELTLTNNSGNIVASGTATLTISATALTSGAAPQVVGMSSLKVKLKPNAGKAYKVRFTLPLRLTAGTYDLFASVNVSALGDMNAADGVTTTAMPLTVT